MKVFEYSLCIVFKSFGRLSIFPSPCFENVFLTYNNFRYTNSPLIEASGDKLRWQPPDNFKLTNTEVVNKAANDFRFSQHLFFDFFLYFSYSTSIRCSFFFSSLILISSGVIGGDFWCCSPEAHHAVV